MNPSAPKKNLEEMLAVAVDLRLQPDFAKWRQQHSEAIEALGSLPAVAARRRGTMIRIIRYSTSAAAVVLLAVGTWWMFFGWGAMNAWAEAIDRLSGIRSATCQLHIQRGGHEQTSKAYLEGSRIRIEDANGFHVLDFLEGKMLWVETAAKSAMVRNVEESEHFVLGSNPLNDLVQMKNAPAERLPDERIGDTSCRVYRVKDTAFMGFKVPWVKLWLDPESKLPVQIHSVVANSQAVTFNGFRWNEPFDEDLLALNAPKGYRLIENGNVKRVQETASGRSGNAVSGMAGVDRNGAQGEDGREIPKEEIAKTLDMLAQRIAANYAAINSWSGTYDLVERFWHWPHRPDDPPQYETRIHGVEDFFAEPRRNRIRIDYRSVEPMQVIGGGMTPGRNPLRQYTHWVKTPEHLLHFSPDNLCNGEEGLPHVENTASGQSFRAVYREPSDAGQQYCCQGFIDPLTFFGRQPYGQWLSNMANTLRGDRGVERANDLKENMTLRRRRNGTDQEYVLVVGLTPHEVVLSAAAGYNVISDKFGNSAGQLHQSEEYKFRKGKGVFVPSEIEFKQYDESEQGANSTRKLIQHNVFILNKTQVNEPIDPAVFEIHSFGLRRGDRMVDRIENRVEVFDGKQFVPADSFRD